MTPAETWLFWLTATTEGRTWSQRWQSLPVHPTWLDADFWTRVARTAAQFERSHAAAKAKQRVIKETAE
jgi:hypothetical protein